MFLPALCQVKTTVPGLEPGLAATLVMADGVVLAASATGGTDNKPTASSGLTDRATRRRQRMKLLHRAAVTPRLSGPPVVRAHNEAAH